MTKMTDLYALLYLNLPDWTRPALCWLSSYLNVESARFSSSLDTTFAVVQQLAEAYAAANPDLAIDTTPDKGLLGDGLGKRFLEDGLTPSDDSMLANFLRTKDKCAAPSSPRECGLHLFWGCFLCARHEQPHELLHRLSGRFTEHTFPGLDNWTQM